MKLKNGWPNIRPAVFGFKVLVVTLGEQQVSIRVVVAPGPIFLLFFFLGFCVFVILAMFFGEEAGPRGLFVFVPLTFFVVILRCG